MSQARYARGFSLMAAVFIVVVLGGLGVFIVIIGEVQRSIGIAAAQGARATAAAQAGVEWGVFRALNNRDATCDGAPNTFTPTGSGFTGFNVTVTCTNVLVQEGAITGNSQNSSPPNGRFVVFTITSIATFGTFGNRDFFQRTMSVTGTDAP